MQSNNKENQTNNEFIINEIKIIFTENFSQNGNNASTIVEDFIIREVKHAISQ